MARHRINRWKGLLFDEQDYSSAEEQLQQKWKTKKGQTWKLGDHELYIGNAAGERAFDTFESFLIEALDIRLDQDDGRQTADSYLSEHAAEIDRHIGICTDPPYDLDITETSMILSRYSDRAVVLASDNIAFGLARIWNMKLDMIWIHDEPRSLGMKSRPVYYHNHIIVLARGEAKAGWVRPRPNFSSVIYVGTKAYFKNHGKGVMLFEEMMAGFKKWKVVIDPFAGYGTSFLAAENLGKRCFGIEIDPKIAAVALERVSKSGIKPRLLG